LSRRGKRLLGTTSTALTIIVASEIAVSTDLLLLIPLRRRCRCRSATNGATIRRRNAVRDIAAVLVLVADKALDGSHTVTFFGTIHMTGHVTFEISICAAIAPLLHKLNLFGLPRVQVYGAHETNVDSEVTVYARAFNAKERT